MKELNGNYGIVFKDNDADWTAQKKLGLPALVR